MEDIMSLKNAIKKAQAYQRAVHNQHVERMSTGKNIVELARKKQGQHPGLSIKEAIEMVRSESPELFKGYLGIINHEDLAKHYSLDD
jgi:hypothetical protein